MGKIRTLALAASVSVSAAFAAHAALLDFTDLDTFTKPSASAEVWGASGWLNSTIQWTLTPSLKPMRYNFAKDESVPTVLRGYNDGFDGVAKPGGTGAGLAYDGDGIGIINDEVGGFDEALVLSFSEKVILKGVHVLDLFYSLSDAQGGKGDLFEYLDIFDTVSGNLITTIKATQLLLNEAGNNGGNAIGGYNFAALDWVGKSLTFKMGGINRDGSINRDDTSRDFSLAGVEVSAVPVPAAGFMLLTALGGLVAARRRKSA